MVTRVFSFNAKALLTPQAIRVTRVFSFNAMALLTPQAI